MWIPPHVAYYSKKKKNVNNDGGNPVQGNRALFSERPSLQNVDCQPRAGRADLNLLQVALEPVLCRLLGKGFTLNSQEW